MADQKTIEPTPKQTDFIFSSKKFTCFSGGYGSGKTLAGCMRGLLLSQEPNNFGLVGRNTYVELRDTTQRSFFELCPPEYYAPENGGQWKPSDNHLKLINGSEIIFRHLDTISEAELKSLNLGWFYIDQAEEISLGVWQVLQSRLRLANVSNRWGFITCNPSPGNWIYDKFKKPEEEGKPLGDEYKMVEATSYENPYLPAGYIETMLKDYPEEMVKRYIEGRWDVVENAIYPEYDKDVHIIQPFEIPKNWERLVSLDYGMVNPTGVLWGAIDFDGNVFIYDEYYSAGLVSAHAKEILRKTGNQEIGYWLIDPSTVSKTREKDGQMWSILEEYEDYGLYFVPANNEKLAGINRVKEFLKMRTDRRNPVNKETPAPKLYIMRNCVNLAWEFPQYQWKKYRSLVQRSASEQSVDVNDHLMDALRYMIMSRFPAPQRKQTGLELVSREERDNMNAMTEPFPKGYAGDDVLGQFGAEEGEIE